MTHGGVRCTHKLLLIQRYSQLRICNSWEHHYTQGHPKIDIKGHRNDITESGNYGLSEAHRNLEAIENKDASFTQTGHFRLPTRLAKPDYTSDVMYILFLLLFCFQTLHGAPRVDSKTEVSAVYLFSLY